MKQIWKYRVPLNENPVINMQVGAKVLSFQEQHGELCLWAVVDPKANVEPRKFKLVGIGHPFDPDAKYIGTTQLGAFVWHLFEI